MAAHPPCTREIEAIPFGTGSLGHGLSLATGLALSQRFTKKNFHVFCILSEGDCNEGSTWEAALFAAHQKLSQLTVIIDANGIQGLGPSKDILELEPLTDKWRAFGFQVGQVAKGNDIAELGVGLSELKSRKGPACLIARTQRGAACPLCRIRQSGTTFPCRTSSTKGHSWKWRARVRKEFSQWLEATGKGRPELLFLTGDLGFAAFENVAAALGERFINIGVCEQNMVSMAASLATEGLLPFCYSIAPFAVFRPMEQIRLDVCIHNLNVKIVGNGGGYGYGIMGATHHALEDLAALSCLPRMKCFVPFCNEDVAGSGNALLAYHGPSYIRMGFGVFPKELGSCPAFAPVRRLCHGERITVVGIGPVVLNAVAAARSLPGGADVFVVSELPLLELGRELSDSLKRTGKLLVVEEHVARGGLGEHLALKALELGLKLSVQHRHALGYPSGRYGSQSFHVAESGLDTASLRTALETMAHG